MDYNQATLHAATGATLMLLGWEGIFVWNYANNTLIFKNGDYILNTEQLKEFKVQERDDWYYIT